MKHPNTKHYWQQANLSSKLLKAGCISAVKGPVFPWQLLSATLVLGSKNPGKARTRAVVLWPSTFKVGFDLQQHQLHEGSALLQPVSVTLTPLPVSAITPTTLPTGPRDRLLEGSLASLLPAAKGWRAGPLLPLLPKFPMTSHKIWEPKLLPWATGNRCGPPSP